MCARVTYSYSLAMCHLDGLQPQATALSHLARGYELGEIQRENQGMEHLWHVAAPKTSKKSFARSRLVATYIQSRSIYLHVTHFQLRFFLIAPISKYSPIHRIRNDKR